MVLIISHGPLHDAVSPKNNPSVAELPVDGASTVICWQRQNISGQRASKRLCIEDIRMSMNSSKTVGNLLAMQLVYLVIK